MASFGAPSHFLVGENMKEADELEFLKSLVRLHFNECCGCNGPRDWHGWMITVSGMVLGWVRVWEDGEIEIDGKLFEDNERLAPIILEKLKPKLRLVK
jgi:hypothetical protein